MLEFKDIDCFEDLNDHDSKLFRGGSPNTDRPNQANVNFVGEGGLPNPAQTRTGVGRGLGNPEGTPVNPVLVPDKAAFSDFADDSTLPIFGTVTGNPNAP